ncbi:MAG: response regulator [bacterium]
MPQKINIPEKNMQKKILVVDDEIQLVEMMKMRLEANSYEVVTAYDGQEAFEAALREKPDLIILDVMMPIMNGFEALDRLKSNPETMHIPVIMLTAKSDTASIFKAEDLRVKDYMTKPCEPKELLNLIKKYI